MIHKHVSNILCCEYFFNTNYFKKKLHCQIGNANTTFWICIAKLAMQIRKNICIAKLAMQIKKMHLHCQFGNANQKKRICIANLAMQFFCYSLY